MLCCVVLLVQFVVSDIFFSRVSLSASYVIVSLNSKSPSFNFYLFSFWFLGRPLYWFLVVFCNF